MKIVFDTPAPSGGAGDAGITLTAAAANRVKAIQARQKKEGKSEALAGFLRISVLGGGCSGYSYSFKFEESAGADDLQITCAEVPGVTLLVDGHSATFLAGSTVDYEESLVESRFIVKNPNAASSCGCGSSFSM